MRPIAGLDRRMGWRLAPGALPAASAAARSRRCVAVPVAVAAAAAAAMAGWAG